ncbi:acyl carrier protein [Clostridiales bacterium F-3ap]|uniref:Acyl carrier protein n=2 Tax=Anaerotalea alkaliphila TaxID=2662126 RepID=A0A7X5KMK1_9FIRM|nr:acyl carrier protein [Anaerotalea alkaliphila]
MKMNFDKLKEIIVEELGVEEDEVTLEASFADDLGADSLDLFELVMSIEDTFGVTIPNEELVNIKTVKSALDYIEANS